jgi:hypothetical protein
MLVTGKAAATRTQFTERGRTQECEGGRGSERVAPKPSPRRTKKQHARAIFVPTPWAAIAPYVTPTIASFVLAWLWKPLTGEVAERPFFEATATVFPVLLLTLAVQARFFARQAPTTIVQSDRPQPKHVALVRRWIVRLYAFQCRAVLAVGEFSSLRALARSDGPSMAQTANAWAALLAAFVALVITALVLRRQWDRAATTDIGE